MKFTAFNPTTGEINGEYEIEDKQSVEAKVKKAKEAFQSWGHTDIKERIRYVKKLGRRLEKNKQKYAELMAKEMGKPLKEGLPEVDKCALLCDYYAKNARKFIKDDMIKTEYQKSYVRFEPLGIVASIMPWNFPFWQPLRFAVPAMITGNVEILKHSSSVPGCGLAIEELFKKCKFPDGVFQAVTGNSTTGTALVEADVNVISVTGSTETGSKIAQLGMKDVKKVVLELGGNDPFVVLDDADIDKAVAGGIAGRFLNCGQSCIAAKRFIIDKKIAEEFTEKFIQKAKEIKVGDPLDPETDMGPLVNGHQREILERQLSETIKEGGKIALGGKRIERKGFFFEPTVAVNVTNKMTMAREEVFGPAAPIITAHDTEEAIKIANDTEYGLGGSIWTKDLQKGEFLTRRINAGIVYVNKNVRSDPRLPFGGVKKSGLGRELGKYGLLEMVNIKSVIINQ